MNPENPFPDVTQVIRQFNLPTQITGELLMFRKLLVIAAAAMACSGAMAASQTFNFNTQGGTLDAISFSGTLNGGIATAGSGLLGSMVVGYTGFSNVLLDGSTSGVNVLSSTMGINTAYSFNVNSSATSHTISYDINSAALPGYSAPAVVSAGSFGSVAHQATPIHVTSSPVAAVPEPETYAMMLAGLGALGFLGRRRKAQ